MDTAEELDPLVGSDLINGGLTKSGLVGAPGCRGILEGSCEGGRKGQGRVYVSQSLSDSLPPLGAHEALLSMGFSR